MLTQGQLPRGLTEQERAAESCLSVLEPIYSLTPKAAQPAAETGDQGGWWGLKERAAKAACSCHCKTRGEVSTTVTGKHRKCVWAVWLKDSLSQPASSLYPLPPADRKHSSCTHLVSGTEPKAPQGKEVSSGAPGQYGAHSGVKAEAVGGISPCRNQKINSC